MSSPANGNCWRPTLSAEVADILVDHGYETAVAALVGNEGAALTDTMMHEVFDNFGNTEKVHTPLVMRSR